MKKTILSILIMVIVSLKVQAQTEKGTWILGGGVNFTSDKNNKSLSLAPSAGYFVMKDVAVGSLVQYETKFNKDSYIYFAPSVKYYFLPLGANVKLFAMGLAGLGSTKDTYGNKFSFTTWELSAGSAFFLNKSIALEFSMAYAGSKFKGYDEQTGFSSKVGFNIHFNKKNK